MNYSIKEVANILNITPTTIRYYDKEGLLPLMERKESGYRIFSENDVVLLQVIKCLKNTNMPIKEIKKFTDLILEGDNSLEERYQIFMKQKELVENQMRELQKNLDLIISKCEYYRKAIENGTEKIYFDNEKHLTEDEKFNCE